MDLKTTKEAGKRMNKKIMKNLKLVLIIAVILLAAICVFLVQDKRIQKNKIRELSNAIEEMERKQAKIGAIKEEIKKISQYSAYEFDYTSIIKFSDKNKLWGMDIPLTGNFFIATIDGKMNIGINAEKVEFDVSTDEEGNVTQVTLTVPHSEILDNYTIQDSLEIYDERNNIFNPVKVTDYKELIVEAEEEQKKKVLDGDLLEKSDEAVQYLLTSHLQAVYGDDVVIKYDQLN